jgi:hypothetical protein
VYEEFELTASTGKLVYEGPDEKATYNARDSGDWDRTTGLAERDATDEDDSLKTCATCEYLIEW